MFPKIYSKPALTKTKLAFFFFPFFAMMTVVSFVYNNYSKESASLALFHTKSQRIDKVGNDVRILSGQTILLKQGHQKPVAQVCVWAAFEYLQGPRFHHFSRQHVSVLGHPTGK